MIKSYKLNQVDASINKIYLLSDLHFGVRVNSFEWLENHLSYFNNFFIPLIEKTKESNDAIFLLGDWYDNRQLLDIYVMNESMNLIEKLSNILPIYFIVGNHDIYKKKDTDINSLKSFSNIKNVHIYYDPVILNLNSAKILLMPWIGSKEEEEEYINQNDFDYVFAHTDMEGFSYDTGREIKQTAVNFRKYSKIKKMFSGHIHKRQEKENFIYLGSPYHTKRSDIGNTKGVYIFNPNKNEFNFIVNDYSPVFQRIPLDTILELTLTEVKKLLHNNYTDIIIPDKFVNFFNLAKFIDIIKDCKYKKLEAINQISSNVNDLSEVLNAIEIKDILTLLEISIEELMFPDDTESVLKTLNRKYYEKASKEDVI